VGGVTGHPCKNSFVASFKKKGAIPNASKAKKGGPGGRQQNPVRTAAPAHKAKTASRVVHSINHSDWAVAKRGIDLLKKSVKPEEKGWKLLRTDSKVPSAEWAAAMQDASSIFVNPNVTYQFRLVTTGTLTTTNGATLATFVSWDPTNITEYSSYLIFMFNEVRIRHAKWTLVPIASTASATTSAAFAISSDLGFTASAPANLAAVIDNPTSRVTTSNANSGRIFEISVSVPNDYLYGAVTSPVGNGPNEGCYGQFQIASFVNTFPTENAFSWIYEGIYEFRSRT